jgi:dihydrofolate reductase
MRSVVNSTFVTLDGVINHMERWHFSAIDEDSDALAAEQLKASDALLMGRRTYEIYAATWPTRTGVHADLINAMAKYVASTTLTSPEWAGTTVIDRDLARRVRELKAQDGGDILMHGFGPVAKTLLREGLLDELHLWFHPALVGVGDAGDRIFEPGLAVGLTHTGTRELRSGVVVLSYRTGTS